MGAGRIVGVADVDDGGVVADGGAHRIQVVPVVRVERDFDGVGEDRQ